MAVVAWAACPPGDDAMSAAATTAATASKAATPATTAPDLGFDVRKVARDVHAVIRRNPPGYLFDCNSAFIIGRDGVAVLDGQFTTQSAGEVIAALRKITLKPVKYVINTHAHDDHISGNQAWRDAYPEAEFVAHEETARDMAGGYLERRRQLAEALPPGVESMRAALAANKGSDGAPLNAEQIAKLENDVALGNRYAAEAPAFRLILPDRTFRDSLTLSLGGRDLTLRFLGRAHTAGDIVVQLPRERIVFSGDLVVWPVPLAGTTSYPLEYGATLDRLREIPHDTLIPGHGPVMRDDAYLDLMSRLMHSLGRQTEAAVARGDSLEQARKSVDLEEFRRAICGESKVKKQLFEAYVAEPGVARAFEQASERRAGR
jgi:glyoxylase-like metal-dependent hydrolase (beta-lactamase superfamily II)